MPTTLQTKFLEDSQGNKYAPVTTPNAVRWANGDNLDDKLGEKQDVINDLSDIRSGASAGTSAYQKPLTGIPASDLSSSVQTSLEKADTALQSHQSKADIGLGNVGNFKAVSTETSQGLTDTEKSNARANIGAGTSSFSGSYDDLTNKPTIPDVQIQADWNQTTTTAKDYIKNKPIIPAAQVNADWNASSGVSQILNKPSSLPASDVYAWAKAATKPAYSLSEVGATASVVAITTNTSSSCSITGGSNDGKTQTIIYTNSTASDLTVTVPTTYETPDGQAIELTCVAGGYSEVNYINVNGTIYARGL